ncbi:MAG: phosphonate ABC transporter ATP-binding protein [Fusobacterium sp. JB021]|nr:phosphonate ABC transporter ATP-binding protein [Fusobacterium sp. JB020]MDP0493614.1 phosphonate ABC transporter ATP-binding protein [Fusobacterium sp. JB021]MDP0507053.1 phosphonate ABC transporter ATP-binding protein [Fusobacterium sp. JB019]
MLKIENLKVTYDKFEAIENLSLKVDDGEFVAIIGSSGSGKSSLIKSINLLVKPKAGHIFIGKEDITLANSKELKKLRREIGFIFQDYNLIDRLSVIENVLIGRLGYKSSLESLLGIFKKEEYKNAMDALEKVGLKEKAFVRADELSGGQKQRVSIAKVFIQNPKLILADEPVASLDIATSQNIMKYFERINKKYKISIIINLHDVNLAKKYAKRIVALKNGKIIFDGHGGELTNDVLRKIYT